MSWCQKSWTSLQSACLAAPSHIVFGQHWLHLSTFESHPPLLLMAFMSLCPLLFIITCTMHASSSLFFRKSTKLPTSRNIKMNISLVADRLYVMKPAVKMFICFALQAGQAQPISLHLQYIGDDRPGQHQYCKEAWWRIACAWPVLSPQTAKQPNVNCVKNIILYIWNITKSLAWWCVCYAI